MKQRFFKLTGVFFILLIALNGCKKDNPTPDPVTKVISPGKQITYFKIVTPAATGIIDTVNKTISVSLPIGTVITSLTTDISLAASHTISPASGVAQNFTTPVVFTVTRPDKTTTQWTVSVGMAAVNVDQDITSSVTWTADKIYIVTGDINIGNNAVLTIQPGTVIRFNAGSSLSIGFSSNATVIANGTVDKPIIFTSTALVPAAGAWEGLFFYDHTLNNTSLSYCKILYAGSNASYGALNIIGCDLSVTNCTISLSGSYGIWTNYTNNLGGFSTFTNNNVNTTDKYGMVINAQKLGGIGAGNTFTMVFGVLIQGNLLSTSPQTWKNLNVPYIIETEVDIDGNLTIEPGTTFKFGASGWLGIGFYASTTFTADGTSAAPIKFTSNAPSPVAGAWKAVVFYDYTLPNSKMNYCIIDYAGVSANHGSLHMYGTSSIIFTNNKISNSSSYGIVMEPDAGFQTFTGNTIFACANHLITISTKHLPDLGTPNTFTAETGKGILVSGDVQYSSDVTWRKQTADYYISGAENDVDGNLTIEPGTRFFFVNDAFFYFGYFANTKLTAVGTSTSKITFTSSATSPTAGAWKGLYFSDYMQSNSALAYCEFTYSGMSGKPAIYTKKSFNVSNTNITSFSSTHAAEYSTGITVPPGTGNNFTWTAN